MKEICSCCGIGYEVFNPALYQPSIRAKYIDMPTGVKLPACHSCASGAFSSEFRLYMGLKVGTDYTQHAGDQRYHKG